MMVASLRIPLVLLGLLVGACGLAAPAVGQVVAPGVGRADFETRLGSTDLVKVHVLYPADDAGAPLRGPHPAVVFIQGGFVKPARYEWQAQALAARGYVVALPEHFLDLAFFGADVGLAARQLLVDGPRGSLLEGLVDPQRIGVAGHSLGGVVAGKLALEGGFGALAFEASYPDTADVPKLPGFAHPSLSLAGSLDCSAKLDVVKQGWASLPSPTALLVLDGVTHYQFTNSQAEDDQRHCTPGDTLESAHGRIAQALGTFFDAALEGRLDTDGLSQVPGASLEVR